MWVGQAVDALVSNREYTQALALIDSGRAGSMAAPDYLLLALAEKQPKTSARYLVRLRDKRVRAATPAANASQQQTLTRVSHGPRADPAQAAAERVMDWYQLWPLEPCLDMLFYCRTQLAGDTELLPRINVVYTRMRLYEAVIKVRCWRSAGSPIRRAGKKPTTS